MYTFCRIVVEEGGRGRSLWRCCGARRLGLVLELEAINGMNRPSRRRVHQQLAQIGQIKKLIQES